MEIGVLFPGQGSQYVGMGRLFYDTERVVREYFEQASSCLGVDAPSLCFASSERDLIATGHAQTAIFIVSCSLYEIFKNYLSVTPSIVAGHSSGEYAALYAAGSLSFVDGLSLISKRALFMEEATRTLPGGMIAIIGLSCAQVAELCEQYDKADGIEQVVQIANYNSPEQTVVAGTHAELDLICDAVREAGGRALPLPVAGAFHSRLMRGAEEMFMCYIANAQITSPIIPVVANENGKQMTTVDHVTQELIGQVSRPVCWWQSMSAFESCDLIIQMGPGTIFAKMLQRQWPHKKILTLNTPADLHVIEDEFGQVLSEQELDEYVA